MWSSGFCGGISVGWTIFQGLALASRHTRSMTSALRWLQTSRAIPEASESAVEECGGNVGHHPSLQQASPQYHKLGLKSVMVNTSLVDHKPVQTFGLRWTVAVAVDPGRSRTSRERGRNFPIDE
ncbi:hypothetical protein QBC36DRAFT_309476 [Triangularia setosa]|uniref:Uncharacterized protein n=1 Tax=Triangularia setosa TaxID=2587417 RepID=A0AAN6WAA8_9PEZI|nr:hypothetical protein QBC36DRAFT_309476 [Podospora setosa]